MARDAAWVVKKAKSMQKKLEKQMNKSVIFRDLKSYAKTKGSVLKKRISKSSDMKRLLKYLDVRKKDMDKFGKELQKEAKHLKKSLDSHRKDLEVIGKRLLKEIVSVSDKKRKPVTRKKVARKRTVSRRGVTRKRTARK